LVGATVAGTEVGTGAVVGTAVAAGAQAANITDKIMIRLMSSQLVFLNISLLLVSCSKKIWFVTELRTIRWEYTLFG
jgi:phosphate/sulfate permease